MTLRRTVAVVPLAVCVAVVAHVLGFGADHAPGGGHSGILIASVFAALVTCLAGAYAVGFARSSPSPIATISARDYRWPLLAFGGFFAFAAMELCEGHLAMLGPGTLIALCALVPVAMLAAVLSSKAAERATSAGNRFARAMRVAPGRSGVYAANVAHADLRASVPACARRTRGRAPPLLA